MNLMHCQIEFVWDLFANKTNFYRRGAYIQIFQNLTEKPYFGFVKLTL